MNYRTEFIDRNFYSRLFFNSEGVRPNNHFRLPVILNGALATRRIPSDFFLSF